MDIDTDVDAIRMCDVLSMYDLTQHVTVPTHISGHTLDLIITRYNRELLLSYPVSDYMVSDHMFVCYRVNMPRPPLETRTISYRKLKQIDNSAFSTDLKDITNTLLKITYINQLVGDYNRELRQLVDRHAPIKSKTIVVRPLVEWFDDELKSLKSQRRKAELIWRWDKNHETLLSFHRARNTYVNALNTKRTDHLSHLILEAKGDSKKLFALVNTLCSKKQSTPLPDDDSAVNLVNEFGNYFKDKIDAIRTDIGVTEAPYRPFREEGVCANLDTFAVVSEDDVRKLVMKSKTTSCALDPMPANLTPCQPTWSKSIWRNYYHSSRTSSIYLLLLGNSHTSGRLHL